MTKLTEFALKIDEIAKRAGDDPFELYRAAVSGERCAIDDDDAVDEIEKLIQGLDWPAKRILDAIVFNNAIGSGQHDTR